MREQWKLCLNNIQEGPKFGVPAWGLLLHHEREVLHRSLKQVKAVEVLPSLGDLSVLRLANGRSDDGILPNVVKNFA